MEPSERADRWKQTSRRKGFLTYHAAMNRRSIAPLLLTLIGSVFMSSSLPAENEDLKPYPKAEEGYERYVFRLPKLENEEGLRLNLIVGKTLQLDTINRYFFSGKGERKSIPGWGYSYYHVKEVGPMAGTRAAAPPDADAKSPSRAAESSAGASRGARGSRRRQRRLLLALAATPPPFPLFARISSRISGRSASRAMPPGALASRYRQNCSQSLTAAPEIGSRRPGFAFGKTQQGRMAKGLP